MTPEGNTIELYIRSLDDATFETVNGQMIVRYADGRIGSGRDPLDVEALFRELADSQRLDLPLPGRHADRAYAPLRLQPRTVDALLRQYPRFPVGPLITSFRMGEVGSDDQQPHVIAFNTWKGTNLPPAPANTLGMRYFTIVLPTTDDLQRVLEHVHAAGLPTEPTADGLLVSDPSHITMLLTDHMLPITR